MFCPNCGTRLPDGSNFCGSCGAKVGGTGMKQTAAVNSNATETTEKMEIGGSAGNNGTTQNTKTAGQQSESKATSAQNGDSPAGKKTNHGGSRIGRILLIAVLVVVLVLVIRIFMGSGSLSSKLVGSWYREGSQSAAFTLYDDGTCEISGEYGTGTWSIVNGDNLRLTNYYGETEVAPIISVKNGCLTIGDQDYQVQYWNNPQ